MKNSGGDHDRDAAIVMKAKPAAAAFLVLLCLPMGAHALDWSYCIAPAGADHRIFISRPFPSIGPKAEADFDDQLARRRMRHDSVQCPRASDEAAAVIMRQHAVDVNRLWGRQVVDIPWDGPP